MAKSGGFIAILSVPAFSEENLAVLLENLRLILSTEKPEAKGYGSKQVTAQELHLLMVAWECRAVLST